ncbi:hypothetical protein Q1695_002084 [Nippostrongylus brasiliensis]|nr:hypothetical protein Q1695_002084 [Nippostrongylus brasiliensis]
MEVNGSCSEAWATAIQSYTSLIYSLVVVMFCVALYIQLRLRSAFHPFFTVIFVEAMVFYATCDFIVVALKIFYSFDGLDHPVAVAMDWMFTYTYAMIMPLECCCLLERLAATLFFNSYEKNRKWWLFLLSQPFCVGFIYVQRLARKNFDGEVLAFVFLGYYITMAVGVVVLYVINRRLTKRLTGDGAALSTRYQLAENIRTLRVFLPMIVFDTLISLVDIVTRYLNFDYVFEPERCADESYYLPVYLAIIIVASGLELILSSLIVYRYPNTMRILLCCKNGSVQDSMPSQPGRILNVFGSDLLSQQINSNYFHELQKGWRIS